MGKERMKNGKSEEREKVAVKEGRWRDGLDNFYCLAVINQCKTAFVTALNA